MVVVCSDLDGVIVKYKPRNFTLTKKFFSSLPPSPFMNAIKIIKERADRFIILTGRKERFADVTHEWLARYGWNDCEIYFMPEHIPKHFLNFVEYKSAMLNEIKPDFYIDDDIKVLHALAKRTKDIVLVNLREVVVP